MNELKQEQKPERESNHTSASFEQLPSAALNVSFQLLLVIALRGAIMMN